MAKRHAFDLTFYGKQDVPVAVVAAFTKKAMRIPTRLFPDLRWQHDRWYVTSIPLDRYEEISNAAVDAGLDVAVFGIQEPEN